MLRIFLGESKDWAARGARQLAEQLEPLRVSKIRSCKREEAKESLLAAGWLLREALRACGGCVEEAPLPIEYNCYGKPYLEDRSFYFNLSHSGKYVVCAVADGEVGIDIEEVKPVKADLAAKILTEEEKAEYALRSPEEANSYLVRKWTEKESVIKYIGSSIAQDMRTLETQFYFTQTLFCDGYFITVTTNDPTEPCEIERLDP